MSPLGIVVVGIGVMLVIVGVSGSQHKLVAALTNKPAKSATTTSTSTTGTNTNTTVAT